MSNTTRNYRFKDVDMLMSAATILESAIAHKVFLQSKRSTWADPYFEVLGARINQAVQNLLGVDSAKLLRQSTAVLIVIQQNALKDLAEIKVQLTEDLKPDKAERTEVLKQLGFTSFLKDVQNGNQKALINLLYQFKTNLTFELKASIVSKGTSAASLDAIMGYADTLKNADIFQEGFKGSRKVITTATLKEFNLIYDAVIGISKIASSLFKDDPAIQDQFKYSKVNRASSAGSTKTAPAITTI